MISNQCKNNNFIMKNKEIEKPMFLIFQFMELLFVFQGQHYTFVL